MDISTLVGSLLINLAWWWISRRILSNRIGKVMCDHIVVVATVLLLLYSAGIVRLPIDLYRPSWNGTFASFPTNSGVNNLGKEWTNFNDNKFGGKSSTVWSVVKETNADNYYLQMDWSITKGRSDFYCGIFSFLSEHPELPVTLRQWNAIQLRCKGTWQQNKNVHFYVQIATVGVQNDAFYEAELIVLPGENNWTSITIPFVSFQQPFFKTAGRDPFDLSKVFKVAFFVRAEDGAEGRLSFDDILFVQLGANKG
ncbi:MAG: CIA30 family protein [Candidatus Electronema sp. V4]|uniref:CIA30 family protein n=1 Tax=Candidatus Electronema sp. V4 TaxID=3454756 RepID=UPI00405590EF